MTEASVQNYSIVAHRFLAECCDDEADFRKLTARDVMRLVVHRISSREGAHPPELIVEALALSTSKPVALNPLRANSVTNGKPT